MFEQRYINVTIIIITSLKLAKHEQVKVNYLVFNYALCSCFVDTAEGGWDNWGPWGACDVTCGTGYSASSRNCINPPPGNDGKCVGHRLQLKYCSNPPCPGIAIFVLLSITFYISY